jgi:hypothetical protein
MFVSGEVTTSITINVKDRADLAAQKAAQTITTPILPFQTAHITFGASMLSQFVHKLSF